MNINDISPIVIGEFKENSTIGIINLPATQAKLNTVCNDVRCYGLRKWSSRYKRSYCYVVIKYKYTQDKYPINY